MKTFKCDLCKREVEDNMQDLKYMLPMGEKKLASTGAVTVNRFNGWAPMSTDLCFKCADRIRALCIEIANENEETSNE